MYILGLTPFLPVSFGSGHSFRRRGCDQAKTYTCILSSCSRSQLVGSTKRVTAYTRICKPIGLLVSSTRLGEFLKADEIEILYRNVDRVLASGGVFTRVTRATKNPVNLSSAFELLTRYRIIDHLDTFLDKLPMAEP